MDNKFFNGPRVTLSLTTHMLRLIADVVASDIYEHETSTAASEEEDDALEAFVEHANEVLAAVEVGTNIPEMSHNYRL